MAEAKKLRPPFLLTAIWPLVCGLQRNIFLRSFVVYSAFRPAQLQTNNPGWRVVFCQLAQLCNLFWCPLLAGVSL